MAKEAPWKNRIRSVILLALFYFLFLGSEYLFDNSIIYHTDSHGVVIAQSYILGISTLGFLFYPVFKYLTVKKAAGLKYLGIFFCFLVGTVCYFLINRHPGYALTLTAGCVLFFLLGILGSSIHYLCSLLLIQDSLLPAVVGFGYAFGILLQFINNNFVSNTAISALILSLSLVLLLFLLTRIRLKHTVRTDTPLKTRILTLHPLRTGLLLAGTIALMTCIFSTLDSEMTLLHASGELNLGSLPRLLLALSGICAGILFSKIRERYQNLFMFCVMLFSTICVVLLQVDGSILISCIIFYLSAGIFAVYFTVSFMSLSYHTRVPELWAGLGRAVNNLCAICISRLTMMLVSSGNPAVIYTITLVIFVATGIALFVYTVQADTYVAPSDLTLNVIGISSGFSVAGSETVSSEYSQYLSSGSSDCHTKSAAPVVPASPGPSAPSSPSDRELHFRQFSDHFALTDREKEVLKVLLTSDKGMQELADRLYISRTMLYRHVASLNEKTSTKSRISLIQFYYGWEPEN